MKALPYLIIILAFLSCSKKSNQVQPQNSGNVTINGTAYKTVVIGNQTWTAVNYNGSGGENYNNGSNDPDYGKLYTLEEAQAITLPAGWRVPTPADYNNLLAFIGGTKQSTGNYLLGSQSLSLELMSTSGWTTTNGNNQLGFNAVPAGIYSPGSSQFLYSGQIAFFLLNIPPDTNSALCLIVAPNQTEVDYLSAAEGPGARESLRFVKDN